MSDSPPNTISLKGAEPAYSSQDHGTYSVTLDGVFNTYNAYTPFLEFDTLKYFAGNLTATPHVLKITNIGTTFFGKSFSHFARQPITKLCETDAFIITTEQISIL